MATEIDVSGHDMIETLQKDRRRRRETELSKGMSASDAALIPLSIAIARLSARVAMAQADRNRTEKD